METTPYLAMNRLPEFALWDKLIEARAPLSFDIEITARCNNNCRHCYINLPANDIDAQRNELSLEEIKDIAAQAVDLGAFWCSVTGGEPLLRHDFMEIYLALRKKGLLVSLLTNACLVTEKHVAIFKKYPPRDVEVTVYGTTKETYERVTRQPGSYAHFRRGLGLLLDAGIKVRLKTMALRSNIDELPEISAFCRQSTYDFFRFDPLLHLRYDGNQQRNSEIISERLSPGEIIAIEQADEERAAALEKNCDKLISGCTQYQCDHLFHCGAGTSNFVVSYDGIFRLCADLWHPDCTFDLRRDRLAQAWKELVPRVRDLRSNDTFFLAHCHKCPIINLCLWCPAHAYLETGKLDGFCPYFCEVAHARASALEERL
ncbi:radical SAM protein [Chloroflexota bacterium]